MSLFTTVLARQSYQHLAKGNLLRQLRLAPNSSAKWVTTSSARSEVLKPDEGFWDKNARLKRPTSPHLTIYKFQITSVLSVTHRGTGLALSGIMSGFGIGMLLLPGCYAQYLEMISSMHFGGALIFLAKFALAWPFVFHFSNGMRHLAWDLGKGFQMKEVYATGWSVVAVATALSLALAAM